MERRWAIIIGFRLGNPGITAAYTAEANYNGVSRVTYQQRS